MSYILHIISQELIVTKYILINIFLYVNTVSVLILGVGINSCVV